MFNFFRNQSNSGEFISSKLFDEKTFYYRFIQDLWNCKTEVIIESPYITSTRMRTFSPIFDRLLKKHVNIYVITRDTLEHEPFMRQQAEMEIQRLEHTGVNTLLCAGHHHRKLAILDRKILWEGSLNILSQASSREVMRRIDSIQAAREMFQFLKLGKAIP